MKCHRHGQPCFLRRDFCRVEVFGCAECERDVFTDAAKNSETLLFNHAGSYTEHRRQAPPELRIRSRGCAGGSRQESRSQSELHCICGPMAICQMFFRDVAVSAGKRLCFRVSSTKGREIGKAQNCAISRSAQCRAPQEEQGLSCVGGVERFLRCIFSAIMPHACRTWSYQGRRNGS